MDREWSQTSQVVGTVLCMTALTSDTSLHLRPVGYKCGGPHGLPRVQNSLERLTELRKALSLQLPFYCSRRIQVRRGCMGLSLEGFPTQLFRHAQDHGTLLASVWDRVLPTRNLASASVSRVFNEASLHWHDGLISISKPPPRFRSWADIT